MVRGGVIEERETEMMAVRWNHIKLHSQIPAAQQRSLQPCGRCFAALVFPSQPIPDSQDQ